MTISRLLNLNFHAQPSDSQGDGGGSAQGMHFYYLGTELSKRSSSFEEYQYQTKSHTIPSQFPFKLKSGVILTTKSFANKVISDD